MGAGHAHNHQHAHATPDSDRRWLAGALAVIVVFLIGEVTVGVLAGSLALLSDAAHMLTDAASIVLALGAIRLAARPAAGRMTFGWKRVEILSAQANGLTLLLLAAWLGYEAIRRLIDPPEVTGSLVLITALVGVVVNVLATWMISRANRSSLNVEGAYQHILNDLFAFIATAVGGAIILLTGFQRADAIATLVVVALMIKAGVELVRASSRIFLEAAPADLDPTEIGQAMAARDGVVEVHDLHIWEITSGSPALSAHVLVDPGRDCHAVREDLAHWLDEEHHIEHATLQVDHALPELLEIGGRAGAHCEDAHGPTHRAPALRHAHP
ncbi:cation diffusion facilitator family transporter [Nocardia sp. CDC159]|uniref:Cation diffusion facilitator family transporter n=1 Tax=Nocardia pulmonis TaxID=2951408 RepID=A0A9X2IVU4_9NOCA|nr:MULTISPECIES: cation diffusion facilitator family transporter [Nocardia]MCM6774247.1 cation diffusion facilitator family transporter [Nocardia pulmonis]MCM6787134.1 cation diffusion facilitator family transporter [Nocardia sp. CDC159]